MKKEHEMAEDPYWSDDVLLGAVPLPDVASLVRLRLHQSEETYHGRNMAELLPLSQPTGSRTYVHARPYVLEPELRLTVGLSPTPRDAGAIGEIVDSEWEGMRHVEIGQAQAWYYPTDRLLVLWECYQFDRWRVADPVQDAALNALWHGFEIELRSRFPHAKRLVTPSWEDLYERPVWQTFLSHQGFAPATPGVFLKTP